MILVINTEYEDIYLYSKNLIDVDKIKEIELDFKKDMLEWNQKKENYILENNINEEDFKNISAIIKSAMKNKFAEKKANEVLNKQKQLYEFLSLNKRPDYLLLYKFLEIGFSQLSIDVANVVVQLNLEKEDIENKLKISFKRD